MNTQFETPYKKDSFIEQLVEIKQTKKITALKILIWISAVLASVGLLIVSIINPSLTPIFIIMSIAAFSFAYYLCSQLNMEFEYVITNQDIDIDCIINKKKRRTMASFTCSDIMNIEKYNSLYHVTDKSIRRNVYFACTPDDSALAFSIRHIKNGTYIIVMTPNDSFKNAVKKYASYEIKNKL